MYIQVPLHVLQELKSLVDNVPSGYQHIVKEIKEKLEEITALHDVRRTPQSRPPLSLPPPPMIPPPPPPPPTPTLPPPPPLRPPPPPPPTQPQREDESSDEDPRRQLKRRRRRRVQQKISQVSGYSLLRHSMFTSFKMCK